jgi:hypothetical protein
MSSYRQTGTAPDRTANARAGAREQRLLLRIGGTCAIAGVLLLGTSIHLHGDLPASGAIETALTYIVNLPGWLIIHVGMMTATVLLTAAFVALGRTLEGGGGDAAARLLIPSAIVGGTFSLFDYAVDGYAFHALAVDWAAASGQAQLDLALMASAALRMLYGTGRTEITIFYGLTVLLAGVALARDGRFGRWIGATGAILGAAALVAGLATFVGVRLPVDFLLFVVIVPIEGLWLVALGVLMWRQAGRIRCSSTPPVQTV